MLNGARSQERSKWMCRSRCGGSGKRVWSSIRRNKRINKLLNEGRLPYVQLAGPGRESRRRSGVESGRTSERTVAFPKSPWVPPFP
jgi:hypothetical protein